MQMIQSCFSNYNNLKRLNKMCFIPQNAVLYHRLQFPAIYTYNGTETEVTQPNTNLSGNLVSLSSYF